ncbi:MAG: HU family DNA-binding protein [Planctomycetota bacterium]|nr:HU family DNA-binding protein [Planctomycetota bacterium]
MKSLLTEKIARRAGMLKFQADEAFDQFVRAIVETVRESGQCRVPGLGTFRVRTRKNVKFGKGDARFLTFRASTAVKRALRKG